MVDRSLGMKRTCPDCSARFYDLNKDPIECPSCGKTYTVDPILPSRQDQQPDTPAPEAAEAAKEAVEEVALEGADDDGLVAAEDADEAAVVDETLSDVPDVDVPAGDDAAFLESDADDAPVADIIPAAIDKDDDDS